MADANGEDLSGIAKWYSQAGTPTLTVSSSYDAAKKTYTVTTKQVTPPTNGQPDKVPVLIPLKVGAGCGPRASLVNWLSLQRQFLLNHNMSCLVGFAYSYFILDLCQESVLCGTFTRCWGVEPTTRILW
jgi:aminopeptidase N